MEKRGWIFLGFIGSIIFFLVFLSIFWVIKNYQLKTLIISFGGALGYFISWWFIGRYFFQIKKQKSNAN